MSINFRIKNGLVNMLKVDQGLRAGQWKKLKKLEGIGVDKNDRFYKQEVKKLFYEMARLDKKNTSELKRIIKKYGWPGKTLAGKRGAYAAWLLAQHATHDLRFQKKCLELLKVAVEKGEAEKKNLAYLTDRILVQENKKQIYGTQFKGKVDGTSEPFPIQDIKKIGALRKNMGLEPFNQYKKRMKALNLRRAPSH